MTILDILLLLLIAAVVGFIAQRLVGYRSGGLLVAIAVGFVGAVFGSWLAGNLGLPEIVTVNVGSINFPIIWAIIGAALFVAVVSLIARGGRLGLRTTPPTTVVLVLAIVLAVLSLLANYGSLSLPLSAYVLMTAAFFVLLLGNLLKGL